MGELREEDLKINEKKKEKETQGENKKAEQKNGAGKKHIMEKRSYSHSRKVHRENLEKF